MEMKEERKDDSIRRNFLLRFTNGKVILRNHQAATIRTVDHSFGIVLTFSQMTRQQIQLDDRRTTFVFTNDVQTES